MLFIKTYLAKSRIHGIGLFAGEAVIAGGVVYKPSPGLDLCISHQTFCELDEWSQWIIAHYGFQSKADNKWYLAFDGIRFCNHSMHGNISLEMINGAGYLVAKKDIAVGDELLQNYVEFENLRATLRNID